MGLAPDPLRHSPPAPQAAGARALLGEPLLWIGALGLVLLCAAVFGRALGFTLLGFDDDINISLNPNLGAPSAARLVWAFSDWSYLRRYVPLGWITLFGVNGACGLSPVGYHATSLVLHALNALVVFWIIARVLPLALPSAGRTRIVYAAWIGAAWWAAHPLRVELAAWASGILNLQGDFFLLLSFAAAVEGVRGGPSSSRRTYDALGLLAYGLSLLSYPTGLGFLGALVALDAYPRSKELSSWRTWAALLARRGPWLVLGAAGAGLALFAQGTATGIWKTALAPELGLAARLVQVVGSLGFALEKVAVPAGLSPIYDTFVDFHPSTFALAATLAAIFLALFGLWALARAKKWGALCLCLGFLSLIVPYLGWDATLHSPSDRYSYLPSVAAAIGVGYAAGICGTALLLSALAGITALGAASASLTEAWRDDFSLLGRVELLTTQPGARAEIQLRIGKAYFERGNYDAAEQASRGAMRLMGLPASAEPLYGKSASRDYAEGAPLALAHNGIGVAMARAGDWHAAENHFRCALDVSPSFARANLNLALLLSGRGETAEPLHCYLRAERDPAGALDPRSASALLRRLADAYGSAGRSRLALALQERAARLSGGD